jgi:hypothetical protein
MKCTAAITKRVLAAFPVAIALFQILILAACGHPSGVPSNENPPDTNAILPQVRSAPLTIEQSALTQTLAGHLYLADAAGVQRFKIWNGVPSSNADRTYVGVHAPIAVDAAGTLYATTGTSDTSISVFPFGAFTAARTLTVPRIRSLAVDGQGRAYVGWVRITGGCPFRPDCFTASTETVSVYAAGASGNASPLKVFAVNDQCATQNYDYHVPPPCPGFVGTNGAAIDAYGDLLLSSPAYQYPGYPTIPAAIYTYGSPASNPKLVRTLLPDGILLGGVAIDASDDLYVDINDGSGPIVAVFPLTATGSASPTRKISIAGALSFGKGIATAAGRLFVPDTTRNFVYEVYSMNGALQTPISKLSVASPVDAKLGP